MKRMVAGLGVFVVVGTTFASTVAYWPLAYEDGVRTTVSTVFANEGSGGTMDAVPLTIKKVVVGGENIGEIQEGDSSCCPMGVGAFPSAYGVYDPMARENKGAATALDFVVGDVGGIVRVEDPDALRLTTFTVEFFMRPKATSGWQCIALMPLSLKDTSGGWVRNCDSWGMRFVNNGVLQVRFCTASATGTQGSNQTISASVAPQIFDGRWHHVAFTVNGKNVKLYYDYMLQQTLTLNQNVVYADDGDLYIGATPQDKQPYNGSICHFRISDEALTAENFLHFTCIERAENVADDVALFIDFEPVDGISTNHTVVFNRAATGSAVHLNTADNATYPSFAHLDPDVYTNKLCGSRRDRRIIRDTQSINRTTGVSGSAAPYFTWFPDDDVFHDNSFTVEMFLKTSESAKYKPYLRRHHDSGSGVQVTMGTAGTAGKIAFGFDRFRVNDPDTIADDTWHHLALVYDKTVSKLQLFRDWNQVSGDMNVTADQGTASVNPIVICGDPGDRTYPIAKIDEVRITKRALSKYEFLSPYGIKGMVMSIR